MLRQNRRTASGAQGAGDLDLTFDQLAALLGNHERADVACPACGPDRRHTVNRRRSVLRLWRRDPEFISYCCARCGARGWAKSGTGKREPRRNAPAPADDGYTFRHGLEMWRAARPAADGSIVATYLRSRGIAPTGGLPATLRALASPPAMIAAFGSAHEPEPGRLAIDETAIRGVHRTLLRPDGSGKAAVEKPKKMWGHLSGWPIMLAPMNDLLGLAITEGIEDALSIHQATGLGAWAAGAACFLPKLAPVVPWYASAITIFADLDRDGQRKAAELARLLAREGLASEIAEP
jgi:hypothetical protein